MSRERVFMDAYSKKKKSLLKTLTMNLVFFLIFILCLEIGLRIIGYGYSWKRDIFYSKPMNDTEKSINEYTILCIGDSFTYGGNVKPNEIYPYRLSKVLQKNKKYNIKIVNKGYCERNSSQTLSELKDNIRKFKPQLVILLGGTSEKYNLVGNHPGDYQYYQYPDWDEDLYYYYPTKHEREKREKLSAKNNISIREKFVFLLKDIVFDLRVYKMVRTIVWHLKQEFIARNVIRHKTANLASSKYGKETFEEIADRLSEYYYLRNDYNMTLELSFKVIEARNEPESDIGFYFLLAWAYEFQDKYDAHDIFTRFDKILAARPEYKNNKLFMRYYKMFENKQEFEKYIYKKFERNLREMLKICQDNNIQMIFQTFPRYYVILNKYIEDIAKEHNVPLVDNYSIFADLSKKNGLERYLIGDGHCTPEGYKIIAQNVYAVLQKENLLRKK